MACPIFLPGFGFACCLGCRGRLVWSGDDSADLLPLSDFVHFLGLGKSIPRWLTSGVPCCLTCDRSAILKELGNVWVRRHTSSVDVGLCWISCEGTVGVTMDDVSAPLPEVLVFADGGGPK